MEVHFAITDRMIEINGGLKTFPPNRKKYSWELTEDNFCLYMLAESRDILVDFIEEQPPHYHGTTKRYGLCKATIEEDDARECCRAALVGDVYRQIPVVIDNIVWLDLKREE